MRSDSFHAGITNETESMLSGYRVCLMKRCIDAGIGAEWSGAGAPPLRTVPLRHGDSVKASEGHGGWCIVMP